MKHKTQTILLTGGGSGGHITPLLSVAREIKSRQPNTKLVYIGQRGDSLGYLTDKSSHIDEVKLIFAGKFRRYHNKSKISQLLNYKIVAFNLRDLFYLKLGFWQTFFYLLIHRPSVIFIKGGYVGVPVGLSAWLLRIPFITHDSDALPGLANRIIGRFARYNATGMPAEFYGYPRAKVKFVGIPVDERHKVDSDVVKKQYKSDLGLPPKARLLLVTGGGNGSKTVNDLFLLVAPKLLEKFKDMYIYHLSGLNLQQEVEQGYDKVLSKDQQSRVKVFGYTDQMPIMSSVADLIVTRAGASTLAGFAAQGKACLVIPNPYLTGGHQLKNANELLGKKAIEVVNEGAGQEVLSSKISELFDNQSKLNKLGDNLLATSKNDAQVAIADLLFDLIKT